jgi:hypothetical protein
MIRNDRCQGEGSGEEVDAHQRQGEWWWEGGCLFTFFSQTQQLFVGAGDLGMQGTLVPLWALTESHAGDSAECRPKEGSRWYRCG